MAPSHVAVGLALAAAVSRVAPEFTGVALGAAVVGSLLPDLDLLAGTHRQTLHAPVLSWVPAVPAVAGALYAPSTGTVGLAVLLVAVALHPLCDLVGGTSEPAPWEPTTDRGVYLHVPRPGRWLAPTHWVRYDGAPEDFLLTVALAVPALVVVGPAAEPVVAGCLLVGAGYTLVRKRVPQLSGRAPGAVLAVLASVTALLALLLDRR
jgi:membrane-bound metal-dependent hydrolase YbcI (DUF457 family)